MKINFALGAVYGQIPQTSKSFFSFVNKVGENEYTEIFYPVKCRDFLGDVVFGNHYKKKMSIYNFNFDGTRQKLDKDATRLLIRIDDTKELENFKKNNNWVSTKYQDNYALVEASKTYQQTIWGISLLSFILRACCYKCGPTVELAKLQGVDANYMKQVKGNWEKLLQFSPEFNGVSGWDDEENCSIMRLHNSSGFVSLFSDTPYDFARLNHYWKEFQK